MSPKPARAAATLEAARPKNAAPYQKSTAREYFESIAIAVVLALFVRTFVFQAFKIPTGSMENNLLIGDHLLVNKFLFGPTASSLERALLPIREVQRGDVVVFKYPEEPERDFIKRVIGLPGETLELKGRTIHINGQPIDEPYAVPAGHYFMMGDNRDNSQDSRYWGFLPREYMKGRAAFIYWSYEAESADYQATGLGEQVGGMLDTVTHFFTRTRWARLLHQIH